MPFSLKMSKNIKSTTRHLKFSYISIFTSIYIYILYTYLCFVCSFVTIPELVCSEVLETFIILSAILLPVKSLVVSAVF